MSTKTITAECHNCESSYDITYMEELVSEDLPERCPFCGETIQELSENYIEDDDDSEDEEEWETDSEGIVDDSENNDFTRYSGTDELMVKMNECFDSWSEWIPETPLEASLKNAVDKAGQNL